MKTAIKICFVIICAVCATACTLSEKMDTSIIACPESNDSITVPSWTEQADEDRYIGN